MGMQEVAIKLNLDSSSFVSSAQNVADAFGKINEKLAEASKAGNADEVERYTKMAANLQHVYNGMAGSAAAGGGTGVSGGGVAGTVQAGGSAINQAVNQAGRGDVFGAGISGAKGGLDIVSKLGDDGAKAAGMFAVPILMAMGINTLTSFYEQQMKGAMDINAMLNNTERVSISNTEYDDLPSLKKQEYEQIKVKTKDGKEEIRWLETEATRTKKNSDNINSAFEKAANAAIEFGYSMEEGMALVKNAAQYGFTEKNINSAERNVFSWARSTGVDTDTLMRYRGSRHRYGDDSVDPLAAAFEVNDKLGMERGQYRETLQGLQQIFEDGISKGFVKGTAEIGGTLVSLYEASGKSKLWQGEQGVQRYMQMNNAVASATSLGSVTDILTYRAAALSPQTKERALKNAELPGGYGYIDNMIAIEQGITGEMMTNIKAQVEGIAGKGNKAGQIEYYKNLFGFNYTGGAQIYEMMQKGMSTADIEKEIKRIQENPKYLSDEKKALETSESIRLTVAQIGATLLPIKTNISNMAVNIAHAFGKEISWGEAVNNIILSEKTDFEARTKNKKEATLLDKIRGNEISIAAQNDEKVSAAGDTGIIESLNLSIKTLTDSNVELKKELNDLRNGNIEVISNESNP